MKKEEVDIKEEKLVFDDFFKIKKGKLQHSLPDGNMTPVIDRLSFERKDSVAAVVHLEDEDAFLFTRQFRYPTYEKAGGWLTELVAGGIEDGEEPEESMKREIEEELGYEVTNIKHLTTFFASPGGTSERIHLYICHSSASNKVSDGGGAEEENEGIEVIKFSRAETEKKLETNGFQDAKTIIGMMMALK